MSHIKIDLSAPPEELHTVGEFLILLSGLEPEEIEITDITPAPTIVEHAQAESPAVREEPVAHDMTDVDATGRPWDERIHSGNRKKIADGTWRKRKGVDPDVYAAVMDEIAPAPVTENPPVPQAEPEPNAAEVFAQPAAPEPVSTPGDLTWPGFLQRLARVKQAGNYDLEAEKSFLGANNIAALPLLASRKDLWESMLYTVGA